MSQLRAPEARPERREGGRHGRPGSRSHAASTRARTPHPSHEARIRPQMLRTAVLPTVVAVLSGAAAVICAIRSSGARPSASLWIALGGAGAMALAAVLAAFIAANRVVTTVFGRCLALRRASAQGQAELQRMVELLRNGEPLPARRPARSAGPGSDAFELLAQEIGRQQEAAVAAVVEVSRLTDHTGEEQKVEVFVNLARRLQSLVHREIQLLDELEHEVEDPDLLKGLFHVDHLATRMRRHAENLAVLGGAVSRRQWSSPVTMTEVLRSAIAEVEQYPRVKLVPPIAGTLRGHAVADVIHLLAELVENATVFSAPHTQVLLRAQQVTAGLALEVEDRGLGMPVEEQRRMNALLADPDQVSVARLLQDGRIGLFVVASLARRHGIAVRLQSNIYGGTQAVLVLPRTLLGVDEDAPAGRDAVPASPSGPVHRPTAQQGTNVHHRPNPHPAPNPRSNPDSGPNPGPNPHAIAPPAPLPYSGAAPVPGLDASPPRDPVVGPAADPRPGARPQPYVPGQPLSPSERGGRPGGPAPAGPPPGARPTGEGPPARDGEHDGSGAACGAAVRPRLPRRSTQEHLAPQLRQPPAPRTEDEHALHDPGLMAAFRRGIDLAEARSESEADIDGRGTGTGTDPAPEPVDRPRTPPQPLPVRGRTAPFAPHRRLPGQDAGPAPVPAPVDDPLEAKPSKE
ncbi:ATP-binding protein [Streptomyces sp. NPDC001279]|uniref:sensor histidine kinase n=1 Tax=Streptomyces sp. NPDC001279 TaxID=3364556 RepID=UPI0036B913D3